MQYPALLVYCDKLSNTLKEKFREFSGKAHVVVEVRHSQDMLPGPGIDRAGLCGCRLRTARMIREATGVPDCFYAGGYDVSFEPVGRGGRNFLQRAKVGFDVEVSK